MSNVLELEYHKVHQEMLDALVEAGIIKYDGQMGSYRWIVNGNVIDDDVDFAYDFGVWVRKDFEKWVADKEKEFVAHLGERQKGVKARKYRFWKPGSRKE